MKASFEITDHFVEAGDVSELLFTPLPGQFSYRKTRRYEFEYEGDEIKLNTFVANTLVDNLSQTMIGGEEAAVKGSQFAIDYGVKPGCPDLEKEAVIAYHGTLENPGFELQDLNVRQRIYVFPEQKEGRANPEMVIRDICNSVIHNWSVIE